ncbi:MAG: hypothetical protein RLP14_01530 [Owenweeksia sp.]
MEEQVQKELRELCKKIIGDTSPEAILDSLTQVQMLYEKLLVINYLQEAEKEKEPDTVNFAIGEAEVTSEKVSEQKPEPQEKPEPEFINESPVPEKELVDDTTPEEEAGPHKMSSEKAFDPDTVKQRSHSLNDRFGSGSLRIGLNDRIAFVKHLFGGAQEDFNRVLSQLNTFASFEEAENFIESVVKPDYDWSQKEEYELRFHHLIRNRFSD